MAAIEVEEVEGDLSGDGRVVVQQQDGVEVGIARVELGQVGRLFGPSDANRITRFIIIPRPRTVDPDPIAASLWGDEINKFIVVVMTGGGRDIGPVTIRLFIINIQVIIGVQTIKAIVVGWRISVSEPRQGYSNPFTLSGVEITIETPIDLRTVPTGRSAPPARVVTGG